MAASHDGATWRGGRNALGGDRSESPAMDYTRRENEQREGAHRSPFGPMPWFAESDETDKRPNESALAHIDKNEVRKAYNHASYLEPMRKLMSWWSEHIDRSAEGNMSLANRHRTLSVIR